MESLNENSIYEVVSLIRRFGKLFGVAPYTIERKSIVSTKKFKLSGIFNLLIALAICVIMLGCCTKLFLIRKSEYYFNQLNTIIYVLSAMRIISGVITVLLLYYNQEVLSMAYEKLYSFDKKMKAFEKLSYRRIYNLTLASIIAIFLTVIGIELIYYFLMEETLEIILYDSLSNGLQLVIHLFVLLYFESYTIILTKNFKFITETSKNLSQVETNTNASLKKATKTIKTISLMYDDLCKGAGLINDVFSFPLFTLISLNFMELLLGIYQMKGNETRNAKSIYWTSIYSILQLLTLMIPGNTESEATEVTKYLTETNINEKELLSNEKNYFLLRTLHQSVSFTACGFFPISMSSLVGQFSTSVSFLLFMFQIITD